MDPLIGAAIAGVVAWISIVLAARIPLPMRGLRLVGAGSLALLGLMILGAPVPASAPLVFLAGGILVLAIPTAHGRGS